MKANVGSYDSGIRFVAGCLLLIAANHGQRWGLAGFAVLASSAGFCPLYWLFGYETCGDARGAPRDLSDHPRDFNRGGGHSPSGSNRRRR
jgi:hypothetical protein